MNNSRGHGEKAAHYKPNASKARPAAQAAETHIGTLFAAAPALGAAVAATAALVALSA